MNRSEFEKEQLYISVVAGMNQRFHQIVARRWTWWYRGVQVMVAVLAILALCLSIYGKNKSNLLPDWADILVAALAALFAVALNVLPLGDWVQEHLDLFRRWCDLREDIDALLLDLTDQPPGQALIDSLKHNAAKVHRISSAEPGLGRWEEKLLKKCEAAEKKSRPNVARECIPTAEPSILLAAVGGVGSLLRRSGN